MPHPNTRQTTMLLATGAALLLAGAAFLALRGDGPPQETVPEAAMADAPAIVRTEDMTAPASRPSHAPESAPASVEALGPAIGDQASVISPRPVTMAYWDMPLPESRERMPCTLIVVDAQDRPVSGARVEVFGDAVKPREIPIPGSEGGSRIEHVEPVGPIVSFTDEAGRCSVQGAKWQPYALVSKEGVGISMEVSLFRSSRESKQLREILVPLLPLAHVTGIVRDASGQPVPGAAIEFLSSFDREAFTPLGVGDVATDAHGRFDASVRGGTYFIRARTAAATTRPREVKASWRTITDTVLLLPGPWTLRGVVRASPQEGGSPVADAWVSFTADAAALRDADRCDLTPAPRMKTDWRGYFEFRFDRPVCGRVFASGRQGRLRLPVPACMDVEQPELELTLELADPVAIAGRIVDEEGRPCDEWNVFARADTDDTSEESSTSGSPAELWGSAVAETGSDGRFSLGALHPDGVYVVTADAPRRRSTLVARGVRPGGAELLLTKRDGEEPAGVIRLLPVSAATGATLTDARVDWSKLEADGTWSRVWGDSSPDERGVLEIDRRDAGATYLARVRSSGCGSAVLKTVATVDGAETRVELPDGAELLVHVTQAGVALPYARVAAERVRRGLETVFMAASPLTGRTDTRGERRWTTLEPGSWTVTVHLGDSAATRAVELSPGGVGRVDVDFR